MRMKAVAVVCLAAATTTLAQPRPDHLAVGYDLLTQADEHGFVRVIVGFETAAGFRPEGLLSGPREVQDQREAIALAQQSLLASLATFDVDLKIVYESIPFLAMTVDREALEFLLASLVAGVVTSIEEDRVVPHALASSIPVIGADSAWAKGFEGAGQTVAVLDTGIEKNHFFFGGAASRVISEACYSTKDLANGIIPLCPNGNSSQIGSGAADANTAQCFSGPGTTGSRLCWHGTHVAGIAAGRGSSFSGVARTANIIAIQVFTRFNSAAICSPNPAPCIGSFTSDSNLGLERVYALRNSFSIAAANMSLGGDAYTSPCDSSYPSTKAIIDNLRSAKIATVIASGNNGYINALSGPACISTAVSVAATTDNDVVAYFSNVASFLDLFAPGFNITSSYPGGTFVPANGTSMAAPHVAGAWAILKGAAASASVTEILSALTSTGVPVTRAGITKPRIQVDDALNTFLRTLTVAKIGTGSGTVTSSPGGVNCGSICSKDFPRNTVVDLFPSPAADSEFAGWSGAADCSDGKVTMGSNKSCTARFDLKPLLSVTKVGDGSGSVSSNPPGINCGGTCQNRYPSGTVVQLTAAPAPGSSFQGWSGDSDCTDGSVTMTADRACEATFILHRTLSISKLGTGSGVVTSSPSGVNCGVDCSESYAYNSDVNLTAVPDYGSEVGGWGGHADCADGWVTMDTDKACTATFNPCSIASEVTLTDHTISSEETHEACNRLIIGPSVEITGSGMAHFRAGNSVEFVEPVSVLAGGEVEVQIGPPTP